MLDTETASLQLCVLFSQPSLLRTRSLHFKPAKVQLDTKLHAIILSQMQRVPCGLPVVSILASNAKYWVCPSTYDDTVLQPLSFVPCFASPPLYRLPLQLVPHFNFSLVQSIATGLLFSVFPFVSNRAPTPGGGHS